MEPLNKFEQKKVDYLNGGFKKVIHTCRAIDGSLLVFVEADDKLGARFKYERFVVGKRGGVQFIKKGNAYDYTENVITDEDTQRYYI